MKAHGLRAKMGKVFKRTTKPDPSAWVAPNVLTQDFHAYFPNQTWMSDITYIRTGEGWLYLCIILDLFSRQIIAWAVESYRTNALVQQAFEMACYRTQPGRWVIFHSDRGSLIYQRGFSHPVEEKGIHPEHE